MQDKIIGYGSGILTTVYNFILVNASFNIYTGIIYPFIAGFIGFLGTKLCKWLLFKITRLAKFYYLKFTKK